uniref:Uncharacterized protein n=1 Tax=Oryza glaberrima TaxID=4538 RepID=I1PDB0_ORYGL
MALVMSLPSLNTETDIGASCHPLSKCRDVFELLENLGRQPLIKRQILRRGCPLVVRCLIGKEKFHSLMGILNINLIVQVIERSFKK